MKTVRDVISAIGAYRAVHVGEPPDFVVMTARDFDAMVDDARVFTSGALRFAADGTEELKVAGVRVRRLSERVIVA